MIGIPDKKEQAACIEMWVGDRIVNYVVFIHPDGAYSVEWRFKGERNWKLRAHSCSSMSEALEEIAQDSK